MCVIITTTERRARPSLQDLERCATTNPHGSGLAWLDGGRVHYLKGLGPDDIHRRLRATSGPAIVHFRIASVGAVCDELRHPFPITHRTELKASGRAKSVLFHNGTWTEWTQAVKKYGIEFPKGEPVSDTRAAAALVARFGFEWLENWKYCRWAQLDAGGIHRIGSWSRRSRSCYYSNLYWLPADEQRPWSASEGADWWKEG